MITGVMDPWVGERVPDRHESVIPVCRTVYGSVYDPDIPIENPIFERSIVYIGIPLLLDLVGVRETIFPYDDKIASIDDGCHLA